jgi:hypothetical protein
MGHLKEINMGYFQHLFGALGYAFECLAISIIFVIHGFLPDIFTTLGSKRIRALDLKLSFMDNNDKFV